MLKALPVPCTSAYIAGKDLLIMSGNNYFSKAQSARKPRLLQFSDASFEDGVMLAEFEGRANALLQTFGSFTFLGLDNKLFSSVDLKEWKSVLEAEDQGNIFWHMAEVGDGTLFVQEYGSAPTGIYRSEDAGETWKKMVSSKEIDRGARHFHSLAYDQYRDLLIATLGDGNLVKMAISEDHGETWKALSTAAYQCLPITVLDDRIVFGMDSAISRGIVIWEPSSNQWQQIHLKCKAKLGETKSLQSSDLRRLSNGIWIMSTGEGSILVSDNLRRWRFLISGENKRFESHMISNESNGIVAVAMIDKTIIVDSETLEGSPCFEDVMQYNAFIPRIRGFGYVIKRLPDRRK